MRRIHATPRASSSLLVLWIASMKAKFGEDAAGDCGDLVEKAVFKAKFGEDVVAEESECMRQKKLAKHMDLDLSASLPPKAVLKAKIGEDEDNEDDKDHHEDVRDDHENLHDDHESKQAQA